MFDKKGSRSLGTMVAALFFGLVLTGPATAQENEPPVATAAARPMTAPVGTLVAFTAMGSTDSDGTITMYEWDFGDGSPVVSGSRAEAEQVYHAFQDEGVYDVTLTVTDDEGNVNDAEDPSGVVAVTIGSGPPGVDGAALFEERCAICHTKLNVAGRQLSVAELVDVLTTGSMANKNRPLSDDEIEAIAFYIALDEGIAGLPPTTTTMTIPESYNAARLHRTACAGCHGETGEGGIGPSLQVLTLSQQEMSKIVAEGIGRMVGLSGTLTNNQIAAVSSYVVRLQSPTATTTTTTVPSTTNGSKLYRSECAMCHGSYGNGDIGPSVQASRMSESETVVIISQGAALMPGYANLLTQEQIANVATYSVGFQTGASTGIILPDAAPGGVENKLGADVYAKTCAACHGSAGEGAMGPSLQASSFDALSTQDAVAKGTGGMPGFETSLSPEEVEAVAAYSVSFQGGATPEASATDDAAQEAPVATATGEGADLFASNCAVCHGPGGQGASAAPINVPFENEQLIEIIRVGISDMPGFAGALNDGQITVLANFVHALSAAVAPPSGVIAKTQTETIVAIQPSRFVEFDTTRSVVPLGETPLLGLALGTLILLAALTLWQISVLHRANKATPGSEAGQEGPLDAS